MEWIDNLNNLSPSAPGGKNEITAAGCLDIMELGKGFLQLQDDHSRRSSLHPTFGGDISAFATRVGCCGRCSVKVERDEESSLRIGKLSLAPYCHLALMVFGFCFLLAGAVLTGLAYSKGQQPKQSPLTSAAPVKSDESHEEKIAGPLFLVIGSILVIMGIGLSILAFKMEKIALRERSAMSRFSFDTGRSDIFAHLDDIRSQDSHSHRSSFLGSTRRSTLSTIAQAVPVGFFMSEPPRAPRSPNAPIISGTGTHTVTNQPTTSTATTTADPLNGEGFQVVDLGSPTRDDDGLNLPALSLRPSIIPIPMFISPNVLNEVGPPSRSDEPFGSIASLGGGSGDIACFPASKPRNSTSSEVSRGVEESDGLTPISVQENGNALTASPKQSDAPNRPPLRATKSEEEDTYVRLEGPSCQFQKRPHSGT